MSRLETCRGRDDCIGCQYLDCDNDCDDVIIAIMSEGNENGAEVTERQ